MPFNLSDNFEENLESSLLIRSAIIKWKHQHVIKNEADCDKEFR